jgi:hypothetical protein
MFKLRFFIGAPHFAERAQVAEADSMQDCAYRALEEARPKAAIIEKAIDAAFYVKPGLGKVPLPPARIEIGVYKDDGQLALFDMPPVKSNGFKEKSEWIPSGDFEGHVELDFDGSPIEIATLEFANTTSAHALGKAVETARQLVATLHDDPAMKPVRKHLTFKKVKVTVERINDNLSLLPLREEPRDWTSLTFPQPRL